MKAKDFFRQVRVAEAELKILNAKISHYEELGFPRGGIVSGTGNRRKGTSAVELAACSAADALSDLEDQRRRFRAIVGRAEGIIKKIPQERYRQLLSFRYLCGKSFRWISDELDYSDPKSVYRAHGWALREAQKILDTEEKSNGKKIL
jgi:hypothetical protein